MMSSISQYSCNIYICNVLMHFSLSAAGISLQPLHPVMLHPLHLGMLQLKRGVMWPAPGLETLLLMYGAQAALSGLCPGQNHIFTTSE